MQPVIDVFWTDLDAAAAALPRWQALLQGEELARAARFRFDRDRDRYIARRGILRLLLSRRLGQAPNLLRFIANPYGKPALASGGCAFNLSYSRELALYAFSDEIAVGCDVEYHDPHFLRDDIPERLFSPAERREFRRIDPEDRIAAFFDGWTRKEAFIKARGLGLALALDRFDVSLAPGDRPALYRGCEGWSARSISPAPLCSAAIIAEAADWRMVARPLVASTLLADIAAAA
ncbi:MAG TPA: 4'-phosphopantetheinyl transferase superfamily protein [Stellaceae bacterium]|nr:4'-phosphopantetheinyl transferase superfamily protein [Stellaceae bacterium]